MPVLTQNLLIDTDADFYYIYPQWLAGGVPVSFTGYTASFVLYENATALATLTTVASANGLVVLGPVVNGQYGSVPAGGVQLVISHAFLGTLTEASATYKLTLTASSGQIISFATGLVTFE